jgi:hypothetical protein
MIPVPVIMGALGKVPWRLLAATGLFTALALAGFRVSTWHESHKALPAVEARLQAEIDCEPATACQERAEEQARLARVEAENAAQAALGKAQAAEEAARRDAAAWRAKYRQAVATDPGCWEWSEQPIRCPVE